MAGRALAFADAEIIRMLREDFVPVTGDDWYERRRQDAEGQFFRKVADQGPRKGANGSTRQGIYLFTADGSLLAYKNCGQSPEATRDLLQRGLAAWRKLPAQQRRPGALTVGDPGAPDQRYHRPPPAGCTIVNVYARWLDRDSTGSLSELANKTEGKGAASRDHLWVTQEETLAMVLAATKKGGRVAVPANLAQRILRFHLIDNTRGEPPLWERKDVRSWNMMLQVEKAGADRIDLALEGTAVLATNEDFARAERGYEARLLGHLSYDVPSKKWIRFDLLAVGDHWGEGTYTRGARPGRTQLGVAFELAKDNDPGNLVPPQAARSLGEYLKPAAAH